jgi:general stress protein 26
MAPNNPKQQREAIRSRINDIQNAMMTTLATNGTLHSRPMATAEIDPDWDTLWFATGRDSAKVDELAEDDRVGLSYVDSSGKHWVSLSGHARIVNDPDKARQLWRRAWQAWFDGPDDPNLVLIAVQPDIAEYWDSDNKAVAALKLATAAVTGGNKQLGEHGSVQM